MQLPYRFSTWLAAWLGSLIGLFLVLPLGLIVIEWMVFPLALIIAAVLAGLSAGWTGTLLARDQTQTQLLPVIGCTILTGIGLAAIFLVLVQVGIANFGPLLVPIAIFSLILSLSAAVATWRLRQRSKAEGMH